jgi:hypothetical protein
MLPNLTRFRHRDWQALTYPHLDAAVGGERLMPAVEVCGLEELRNEP